MSLNLGKFADLLKEDPHSTQCHPLVKTWGTSNSVKTESTDT